MVSYTQLFSFITWTSVGIMGATAAVAGQNLGAGHPDRTARSVNVAAGFGLSLAAGIGVAFLSAGAERAAGHLRYGRSGRARRSAVELLRYLAVSGLFITVALAYTGGLQGTGDTKSPMYISIVSQIIIPLGMCWLIQTFSTLDPHEIWLAIVLGHFARALLSILAFRRGHWRDIRVDIGTAKPA